MKAARRCPGGTESLRAANCSRCWRSCVRCARATTAESRSRCARRPPLTTCLARWRIAAFTAPLRHAERGRSSDHLGIAGCALRLAQVAVEGHADYAHQQPAARGDLDAGARRFDQAVALELGESRALLREVRREVDAEALREIVERQPEVAGELLNDLASQQVVGIQ